MDLKRTLIALSSNKRLEMTNILSYNDLSAPEVFSKMKSPPVFRQSVNRDLDVLVEVGILKKFYHQQTKKILYGLIWKSLEIDFRNLKIVGKEN